METDQQKTGELAAVSSTPWLAANRRIERRAKTPAGETWVWEGTGDGEKTIVQLPWHASTMEVRAAIEGYDEGKRQGTELGKRTLQTELRGLLGC